jgi:Skp family chaperone for outer membrane proteins
VTKTKVFLLFISIILLSLNFIGCVSKGNYDAIKQEYDALQSNLTSAQREYEFLQSQLTSLQKESEAKKADLDAEIARRSAKITEAQNTNSELTAEIAELQSQLDTVLNTEIKQTYAFSYQNKDFTWELSIPLKTYLYYKEKPEITDTSRFNTMVKDNYADSLMNVLIRQIKDAVLRYNFNNTDTVNLIGTFVQSLIRANNDPTTPYDDSPRYPIQTLFDQGIDSEDTSILTAAILYRLEYTEVIFVFNQPEHIGIGVYAPAVVGLDGWEYQAKRYIYLETTGELWNLGYVPYVYLGNQPEIYPVGY